MMSSPSAGHGLDEKWFKSSYSTDDGPACVEVAVTPDTVRIRDSKRTEGPHLTVGAAPWSTFVSYAAHH
ncbi:DUF397 domain-containing protein [Streptomyces caeni]|uniref:DUF397 domain-containing protein n=1 Tax=Streptomyces caeni TaxID=2307231 RepID=A0ABW4IRG8_9ACTN